MAIAIANVKRVTDSTVNATDVATAAFDTTVASGDAVIILAMSKSGSLNDTRFVITDSVGGGTNTYDTKLQLYNDPCGVKIFSSDIVTGSASFVVNGGKAALSKAVDMVAVHITGWDGTDIDDGAAVSGSGTGTNGSGAMNSTAVAQDILLCCISFGDDATHSNNIGTVQGTPAWTEATKNSNATVRWESNYASFATSSALTTPTYGWPSMTNPNTRAWAIAAIAIKGTAGGGIVIPKVYTQSRFRRIG